MVDRCNTCNYNKLFFSLHMCELDRQLKLSSISGILGHFRYFPNSMACAPGTKRNMHK